MKKSFLLVLCASVLVVSAGEWAKPAPIPREKGFVPLPDPPWRGAGHAS